MYIVSEEFTASFIANVTFFVHYMTKTLVRVTHHNMLVQWWLALTSGTAQSRIPLLVTVPRAAGPSHMLLSDLGLLHPMSANEDLVQFVSASHVSRARDVARAPRDRSPYRLHSRGSPLHRNIRACSCRSNLARQLLGRSALFGRCFLHHRITAGLRPRPECD